MYYLLINWICISILFEDLLFMPTWAQAQFCVFASFQCSLRHHGLIVLCIIQLHTNTLYSINEIRWYFGILVISSYFSIGLLWAYPDFLSQALDQTSSVSPYSKLGSISMCGPRVISVSLADVLFRQARSVHTPLISTCGPQVISVS